MLDTPMSMTMGTMTIMEIMILIQNMMITGIIIKN